MDSLYTTRRTIAQEWGDETEEEMLNEVEEWLKEKMMEMLENEEFLTESDEPEDKIMDFEIDRSADDDGWSFSVTTINNQGDSVDIAVELNFTREQMYHWDGEEYQTTYGGTRWELCPSSTIITQVINDPNPAQ